MIVFKDVSKIYGDVAALDKVSFFVEPGEFVVFTGASGAGKTTLAKLLIKEISASDGMIQVGEFVLDEMRKKEVPVLRRQIGVIFQDFRLLPDRTAAENIALSLEILNKPSKVIDVTVNELLKVINMEDKANHFPNELSGGEVQRIVIARALATEPAVIFADEPTGNLDDETGWQIIELLQRINESGTAVVLATHNQNFVDKLKKRVIRLEKGKLIDDSDPKPLDSVKKESKEASTSEKEDQEASTTVEKKSKSKTKKSKKDSKSEKKHDKNNDQLKEDTDAKEIVLED